MTVHAEFIFLPLATQTIEFTSEIQGDQLFPNDYNDRQNGEGDKVLRCLRVSEPFVRKTKITELTDGRVAPDATEAQMKTAYRKGALKHHPGMRRIYQW